MKKLILSAAVIAAAALALTAKAVDKDPVVMTVDNRDVHLSELEYLYNKNNNQQLTPITFDEYVDLFVNYKLKVAEALNARRDTTAEFKSDFQKFRRDLAQPYMRDEETAEKLVNDAYEHTKEDVFVSHIMLPLQDPDSPQKLDSIRALILNGTITFEDAATNNSIDRPSAARGGRMGWVTGMGPYPWPFEEASYNTPVGAISPVINSGAGYHLVRPEERRPARGEVQVQHILVLTRGLDEEATAKKKEIIDSIYQVVIQPGVDFSEVAMRESEDPGSARQGGLLDWFGTGRMVAEFDSVSFALPDGAISEPFATSYGYHIVHKLGHRGVESFEKMRPQIEKAIAADNSRANLPIKVKIAKTAEATGSSMIPNLKEKLIEIIGVSEGETSPFMIDRLETSEDVAFTVNGKTTTIGEVLVNAPLRTRVPVYAVLETAERAIQNAFTSEVINYIVDDLEQTEPAYRNLVNEYREGLLLYDISNSKVWERATTDTIGLNNYFIEHRDKYSNWTSPHYKAYVIFAQNDSTLNAVMDYAKANYGGQRISEINQPKFTSDIKAKFGNNVKVERVIASQGDNPYTDYLGFGGEAPDNANQTWSVYAAFADEIINQPEEVSDCRGAVINDYQTLLEQEWLKELHKKYKVKINKKVLKEANKK